MLVAPYDGGSGGGAPSNSLLCGFQIQRLGYSYGCCDNKTSPDIKMLL